MVATRLAVVPARAIGQDVPTKPHRRFAAGKRFLMNGPGEFDRFAELVLGRRQIGVRESQQVVDRAANRTCAGEHRQVPARGRLAITRVTREPTVLANVRPA